MSQLRCDVCHSSFSSPQGLATHRKWKHAWLGLKLRKLSNPFLKYFKPKVLKSSEASPPIEPPADKVSYTYDAKKRWYTKIGLHVQKKLQVSCSGEFHFYLRVDIQRVFLSARTQNHQKLLLKI